MKGTPWAWTGPLQTMYRSIAKTMESNNFFIAFDRPNAIGEINWGLRKAALQNDSLWVTKVESRKKKWLDLRGSNWCWYGFIYSFLPEDNMWQRDFYGDFDKWFALS